MEFYFQLQSFAARRIFNEIIFSNDTFFCLTGNRPLLLRNNGWRFQPLICTTSFTADAKHA